MTRSPQLRRLHFLNALFAPVTGRDLYLARQIDAAIASNLGEDDERQPSDPAFVAAAAEIFRKLLRSRAQYGFFHWDAGAGTTDATPLFARAGLMEGLKHLARFPEATLLVTNLRQAHCPSNKRWTAGRRREYHESLSLIRDLAAARSRRSANLNLLFL
jgi:hypothetical protein